jgi:hypothetical protein
MVLVYRKPLIMATANCAQACLWFDGEFTGGLPYARNGRRRESKAVLE